MDKQIKELLSPAVLSRINDFNLMARLAVEGFLSGYHRSICRGYGGEFLQYRGYVPGDDLKYVDWKLFARQDKVCMKVFQEETNMRVAVLLDASASMAYKGDQAVCSKFEYGTLLAACLLHLCRRQGDQVGLFVYADDMLSQTQAGQSAGSLNQMFAELARVRTDGVANHALAWQQAADYLQGRGMMVILSDFHGFEYELDRQLRTLHVGHREAMLFQLLDHDEITLPFTPPLRFIDSESRQEISTAPHLIKEDYQSRMASFMHTVQEACLNNQTDYMLADTSRDLADSLTAFLNHRTR